MPTHHRLWCVVTQSALVPLPYAPPSIDTFEGIQMISSCPLGLSATLAFQRTQGTQKRPRPLAWPGLRGLPPCFCLPVPPLPLGARRGLGLALSPSLNHSCLKLPCHREEATEVLGEDDPAQSQVICEGLGPGPPPPHLSPQSVKLEYIMSFQLK